MLQALNTMDYDDDMIIIIVGDGNEVNQPIAMPIKEEPDELELDESVLDPESILEAAARHGEYTNLKEEEYHDCEYLEMDFDNKLERKQWIPQSINSKNVSKLSYIDQLRRNFPKMRNNDELIVAHLAQIMKHIKPPEPPNGFCVNNMGTFECAFCDSVSLTLPIAQRHYQKKHGSRYLICYSCGSDYRCTTSLYKHEKRCTSSDAVIVLKARGRYLGRKGRRRPYLTLNKFDPWDLKNDTRQKKRYLCSQCTASFSQKDALQSHEHMHRGERPYRCEQCPVAYTSALALRRHLARHNDVQYVCDECERSFKAKTTLISHLNTHLPQRKYPCDRCSRRFAQKSALEHHINRDHLNIPPPFACDACPKRFPRVSNLKAHMKAKHGMTVMTRKMFIKALPSMKEAEVKQATILFNRFQENVITAPIGESIFNVKGEPRSVDDDISTSSDSEHTDTEPVNEKSEKSSIWQVITEVVPIKDEKDAVDDDVTKYFENEEVIQDPPTDKDVRSVNEKDNSSAELVKKIEVAQRGKVKHSADVDLSKTKINNNTLAKDMPDLISGTKEPKMVILGENEVEIKSNCIEIVPEATKNVNTKDIGKCNTEIIEEENVLNESPSKSKVNLIRRAIPTRSGDMKTRSGMIVNKVKAKENRSNCLRKKK